MANEPKIAETPKVAEQKIARLATETVSTINQAAAKGAEETQKMAETTAAQGRVMMDQASKAAEGALKAAEQMAEFGRGNVETMVQVTQTYMAGLQDLGRQTFAMMQGLTDHSLEAAKALSSVKSLKEAAEVQSTYARSAMDKVISDTTKLQESAFQLAEKVSAPVSQRVSLAMQQVGKPLAA